MKAWTLLLRAKRAEVYAAFALLPLSMGLIVFAADTAALRSDRGAIERVYYKHRLGEKPPFEQLLPPATLDALVQLDLRKEAALERVYGVRITPEMLDAEVRRIDTTSRAPDMLAEIKAALGNDSRRFANVFAKPILVERLLHQRFDNDDALHAAQRRKTEELRNELLARKQKGAGWQEEVALLKRRSADALTEISWQLGARTEEPPAPDMDAIEIQKRFGPNAQILSSPGGGRREQNFYFADLPGELQNVLSVQLRRPGDISAVIETDHGFLLYVAKQRTAAVLSVAQFSLSKRSYEQWLDERN